MHKIVIDSTVQPEVVTYSFTAGNGIGSINLKLVRTNQTTGSIIYNVNTTIDYGCDASTFLAALKQFDSFKNY